ncbi:hypothetical protein E2C01_039337 [Portunus trituberculatus]|uniref:Uncharacterized protein n=1 Tax=Portunus trituberculatus TaxID=210409 RepID=A0A5B7FGL0_PORTR|nr:hypothetical protein [Portunus trituberculatus]
MHHRKKDIETGKEFQIHSPASPQSGLRWPRTGPETDELAGVGCVGPGGVLAPGPHEDPTPTPGHLRHRWPQEDCCCCRLYPPPPCAHNPRGPPVKETSQGQQNTRKKAHLSAGSKFLPHTNNHKPHKLRLTPKLAWSHSREKLQAGGTCPCFISSHRRPCNTDTHTQVSSECY